MKANRGLAWTCASRSTEERETGLGTHHVLQDGSKDRRGRKCFTRPRPSLSQQENTASTAPPNIGAEQTSYRVGQGPGSSQLGQATVTRAVSEKLD
jgi:hypothetical protein